MIEIHGRDDAQLGLDHIGGVQPPSKTHFQHHHVDAFLGEQEKRHGGDGFEIRSMQVDPAGVQQIFDDRVNALESLGESG